MLRRTPARDTPSVRRTAASIIIIIGLVIGAVTLSGWWVRRTAFVTSRTEALADDILSDPILRGDLARRISEQVSTQLGADPLTVRRIADSTRTSGCPAYPAPTPRSPAPRSQRCSLPCSATSTRG